MEKTGNSHYLWVDYAKFLSLFLVTFFHCPSDLPLFLSEALSLLRIPCFFFLAGFLFKIEKYPSLWVFVRHRSKQLLIPYFFFFTIFYIYWLIIGKEMGDEKDLSASYIAPVFEYLYGRPDMVCKPLWFLSCLFLLQILYYIIIRTIRSRVFSLAVIFVFPVLPYVVDLSNSPWMFDNVCSAIPFYGIANLYKKEIIGILEKRSMYIMVLPMLLVYVSAVFLLICLDEAFHYPVKIIGSFCIILPVLFGFQYLSNILGEIRIMKYISLNAIVVLALHTYFIKFFMIVQSHIPFVNSLYLSAGIFSDFVLVCAIMALMPIPIYLINRYCPFILGRFSICLQSR